MPARASDRLEDILECIAEIDKMMKDRTRDDLAKDRMVRLAFERSLEIISEASRHLPIEWKSAHAEVPWQSIATLGNRLRHAYWSLDLDILLSIHADGWLRQLEQAAGKMKQRAEN